MSRCCICDSATFLKVRLRRELYEQLYALAEEILPELEKQFHLVEGIITTNRQENSQQMVQEMVREDVTALVPEIFCHCER